MSSREEKKSKKKSKMKAVTIALLSFSFYSTLIAIFNPIMLIYILHTSFLYLAPLPVITYNNTRILSKRKSIHLLDAQSQKYCA